MHTTCFVSEYDAYAINAKVVQSSVFVETMPKYNDPYDRDIRFLIYTLFVVRRVVFDAVYVTHSGVYCECSVSASLIWTWYQEEKVIG